MTLSDRLAAGADAVWSAGLNPSQADARRDFETALRAAFPGLFDGSAWVAPWEAPQIMREPGADGNWRNLTTLWRAARDAHLKTT